MENNFRRAEELRNIVKDHEEFFKDSVPLIASENLMSPMAMEMLLSDFGNRYAEGLPGQRYYQGNIFVDKAETIITEAAKELFNVPQADPRPISGTNANQGVAFGLLSPGDTICAPDLSGGGHISAAKFGTLGFRGLNIINYPYDEETMTVDPSGAEKIIRESKPKVCLFGQSVFLFPAPLKELRDVFQEVECKVWYDGAHVLGLIAGGKFQDPMREGADVMTGSTHKTFPGPQHGIIVGNTDEKTWKKVQRGVFPGVLSNHHLNTMAALGITIFEMMDFGREYASSIVENAKAMAEELHALGVTVLGEKRGFTESHTLVADVRKFGGGKFIAEKLEKCGIVLNKNLIPADHNRNSQDPSGIRIGTQEITRIGMGKSESKHVAEIIVMAMKENADIEKIRKEVAEFKSNFNEVKYCYGKREAYGHINLFR